MMSSQMKLTWIRCNNCYLRIDETKKPFSLTQCGHVYCIRCCKQAVERCVACNNVGTATTLLTDPMIPPIVPFFSIMQDSLELLQRVANFQDGQLKIILRRLTEVEKKYEISKDAYRRMEATATNFQDVYKKTLEKCKTYKYHKMLCEQELNAMKEENMKFRSTVQPEPSQSSSGSKKVMFNAEGGSSQRSNSQSSRIGSFLPYTAPMPMGSISSLNSTPGRELGTPLVYEGPFAVPTITRVPKSAITRFYGSSAGLNGANSNISGFSSSFIN